MLSTQKREKGEGSEVCMKSSVLGFQAASGAAQPVFSRRLGALFDLVGTFTSARKGQGFWAETWGLNRISPSKLERFFSTWFLSVKKERVDDLVCLWRFEKKSALFFTPQNSKE